MLQNILENFSEHSFD